MDAAGFTYAISAFAAHSQLANDDPGFPPFLLLNDAAHTAAAAVATPCARLIPDEFGGIPSLRLCAPLSARGVMISWVCWDAAQQLPALWLQAADATSGTPLPWCHLRADIYDRYAQMQCLDRPAGAAGAISREESAASSTGGSVTSGGDAGAAAPMLEAHAYAVAEEPTTSVERHPVTGCPALYVHTCGAVETFKSMRVAARSAQTPEGGSAEPLDCDRLGAASVRSLSSQYVMFLAWCSQWLPLAGLYISHTAFISAQRDEA